MADRERSLVSYLLLPRPYDALCKAPLALMAYGLVWVSGPEARTPLAPTLVAWALFELVLYQSRYTLNDLADAEVDRLHVAAAARGRLPAGAAARRGAVVAIALRVVVFLAVALALPAEARVPTLVAALGFVAATASYERARAPMRRGAEGTSGLPVIALVGAGYAVRIGFGAALAGATGGQVAAIVAFGWAFGTLGVVMAWTLEAAGLRSGGDTTVLARKAHIATIARLVGDDPAHLAHPLLVGNGARLAAALLAASSAAAVAVGATLGSSPAPAAVALLVVLCAGAAPALLAWWPSLTAGVAAAALSVSAAGALGPPELILLLATITATVAVARSFTPATLDLNLPADEVRLLASR